MGPRLGPHGRKNWCVDSDPRQEPWSRAAYDDLRKSPSLWEHPAANKSHNPDPGPPKFKDEIKGAVFRDPYGHNRMPVWLWAVDPGLRRCIISGDAAAAEKGGGRGGDGVGGGGGDEDGDGGGGGGGADRRRERGLLEEVLGPEVALAGSKGARRAEAHVEKKGEGQGAGDAAGRQGHRGSIGARRQPRRRLARQHQHQHQRDLYDGRLETEPCLNQPPVVPFAFDRLSGLPARCVDALGLCIGSLTSMIETERLLERGLIPPTRRHLGRAFKNVTCGHVGRSGTGGLPTRTRDHHHGRLVGRFASLSLTDLPLNRHLPPPPPSHVLLVEKDSNAALPKPVRKSKWPCPRDQKDLKTKGH